MHSHSKTAMHQSRWIGAVTRELLSVAKFTSLVRARDELTDLVNDCHSDVSPVNNSD